MAKNTKPHPMKKSGGQARAKEVRRELALERNAIWAKLTAKEQIDSLDARGVVAKKQRTKIQKALTVKNKV